MKISILFVFFLLLLSFFFVTQPKSIWCVRILCIPNDCFANGGLSCLFKLCLMYYWRSTTSKLFPSCFVFLFGHFLGFPQDDCGRGFMVRPHPRYRKRGLQAVTSLLGINCACVSRSLFIFSINLMRLKSASPAENGITYL